VKINEIAKDNFKKEMRQHKDFFQKYGIFVVMYTDSDLADMRWVFVDLRRYLERKEIPQQLRFHIIVDRGPSQLFSIFQAFIFLGRRDMESCIQASVH
jgi:hypothetical protein